MLSAAVPDPLARIWNFAFGDGDGEPLLEAGANDDELDGNSEVGIAELTATNDEEDELMASLDESGELVNAVEEIRLDIMLDDDECIFDNVDEAEGDLITMLLDGAALMEDDDLTEENTLMVVESVLDGDFSGVAVLRVVDVFMVLEDMTQLQAQKSDGTSNPGTGDRLLLAML